MLHHSGNFSLRRVLWRSENWLIIAFSQSQISLDATYSILVPFYSAKIYPQNGRVIVHLANCNVLYLWGHLFDPNLTILVRELTVAFVKSNDLSANIINKRLCNCIELINLLNWRMLVDEVISQSKRLLMPSQAGSVKYCVLRNKMFIRIL